MKNSGSAVLRMAEFLWAMPLSSPPRQPSSKCSDFQFYLINLLNFVQFYHLKMSNLRRPIRVLLNELKLSSPRSFHVGPKLSAKQNLRRAPSVIAKTRQSQSTLGVTRVKKTFNSEVSLPPILLLQSASKSGVLSISPEKAIDVLRRYQELEGKSGKDWEQKLCAGKCFTS